MPSIGDRDALPGAPTPEYAPRPVTRRPPHSPANALLTLALAGVVAGCASAKARRGEADREVYRALEARRASVTAQTGPAIAVGPLDVDDAERRGRLARAANARIELDLEGALRLAAEASREYRAAREDVYLKALSFTAERHRFRDQYALGATGALTRDEGSGTASASPSTSVSRNLESGGSFVLKLATDFLKTLAGGPADTARTLLSANLVLPLVRGSGREVARESLTQSERDVLYELRSFARFQQEFTDGVATSFYRVLAQRDTVTNEELTAKSLERVLERSKAFGPEGAGRLPDFEVDQARQDVLSAKDRVVRAQQGYEEALDRFKLELGLPPATTLLPKDDALEVLRRRGLEPAAFDLAHALATARTRRLDLENARDQRDDASRKVLVAANGLGAQVDLALGAALTGPGASPLGVRGAKGAGTVGLDVSLPVERLAERNAYRAALVQEDRAHRAVEALDDAIVVAVRRAWRTLEQARTSYDIQWEGVRLATRRVESADLNLQYGKATTRDVLEAEDALIKARNALTTALIDHAVARLDLERDTGVLRPDAWAAGRPPPPPAPSPSGAGVPATAPAAPSATPAVPAAPLPPSSGAPSTPK